MANRGGKRRRSHGLKFLVPRHGHGNIRNSNASEKAIETRERRDARREIAEQLEDVQILPPVSPE